MKFAVIIILLVSIEAQSQTIADIARAERKRREALKSKIELQEFGKVQPVAPPAPLPVPEPEPAKEEAKPEEAEETSVAEKLQEQRVDLIKTRAQLLVKLDQVRDDPEQVKAIELELIGLTKIAESLKLQHLAEAAKTQP